MRRRVFAGLVLASLTIAYACSFPSVTFEGPTGPEAGTDATASDVANDTPADVPPSPEASTPDASEDDASADAGVDSGPAYFDAAVFDAAIPDAGRIDAAACTSCDCDKDTFVTNMRPGCEGETGNIDCDDDDPRTHPFAGPYPLDAEAPRHGDWNCDNAVTKSVPENVRCESNVALTTECTALGGFTTVVACGQEGDFVTCREPGLLEGLTCLPSGTTKRRQLCQ